MELLKKLENIPKLTVKIFSTFRNKQKIIFLLFLRFLNWIKLILFNSLIFFIIILILIPLESLTWLTRETLIILFVFSKLFHVIFLTFNLSIFLILFPWLYKHRVIWGFYQSFVLTLIHSIHVYRFKHFITVAFHVLTFWKLGFVTI